MEDKFNSFKKIPPKLHRANYGSTGDTGTDSNITAAAESATPRPQTYGSWELISSLMVAMPLVKLAGDIIITGGTRQASEIGSRVGGMFSSQETKSEQGLSDDVCKYLKTIRQKQHALTSQMSGLLLVPNSQRTNQQVFISLAKMSLSETDDDVRKDIRFIPECSLCGSLTAKEREEIQGVLNQFPKKQSSANSLR